MDQKRPTATVWREGIGAQRASGRSIREWCWDNGVHEHGFYWWRTRLGRSPTGTPGQRTSLGKQVRFAEVVVTPASAPASPEPIRLRLSRDRELSLPGAMAVADVAALVRGDGGLVRPRAGREV